MKRVIYIESMFYSEPSNINLMLLIIIFIKIEFTHMNRSIYDCVIDLNYL
jgi:hypothetical protein